MTVRELPASEWSRLAGTDLEMAALLFDPSTTRIMVIERDDQIVGTLALWSAWHVDGLWIHPTYRRQGSVFRRILTTLQGWMRDGNITGVIGASGSSEMTDYLTRLPAIRVPGELFVWHRQELR